MKKNYLTLVIISALSIFTSCEEGNNDFTKDEILANTPISLNLPYVESVTIENPNSRFARSIDDGEQKYNKMLSFNSWDEFYKVQKDLEKNDKKNKEYIRSVIGENVQNEDYIEDMFTKHSLNENRAFEEFEKQANFKSLRAYLYDKESEWLQNSSDDLDLDKDPDNHFVLDSYTRTLLNPDAEVVIANSVYRFYDWGYVKIKDLNPVGYYRSFNNLERVNNSVEIKKGPTKISNRIIRNFETSKRRKMKIEVSIERAAPLRSNRIVARTKYYNKFLGVWKRKKADLETYIKGNYWVAGRNIFVDKKDIDYGSASEVIIREKPGPFQSEIEVEDNALFSEHKLWGEHHKKVDFYDGEFLINE